jgi:uncharacterized protein (DUF2141 family)
MVKLWVRGCIAGSLALASLHSSPVAAAETVLGSVAHECAIGGPGGPGGAAVLVTVTGFRDRKGNVRVQDYRGTKDEYLATGKFLHREDVNLTPEGDMTICLPLPGPGAYAIVALHDRDSNGRLNPFSDGIGFSNNPRLGLSKPAPEKTLTEFGHGVSRIRIVLNYLRGLSVRPVDNPAP